MFVCVVRSSFNTWAAIYSFILFSTILFGSKFYFSLRSKTIERNAVDVFIAFLFFFFDHYKIPVFDLLICLEIFSCFFMGKSEWLNPKLMVLVQDSVRWQNLVVTVQEQMEWLKLEKFQCTKSIFHERLQQQSVKYWVVSVVMAKSQPAKHVHLHRLGLSLQLIEGSSNRLPTLRIKISINLCKSSLNSSLSSQLR